MDDLISRQDAIKAIDGCGRYMLPNGILDTDAINAIRRMPSAQPTLYGYKIEHLAYIARVMEKEGVTADYAVRTFDDISRAVRMIIDEMQKKISEVLYGRFNQQTGSD